MVCAFPYKIFVLWLHTNSDSKVFLKKYDHLFFRKKMSTGKSFIMIYYIQFLSVSEFDHNWSICLWLIDHLRCYCSFYLHLGQNLKLVQIKVHKIWFRFTKCGFFYRERERGGITSTTTLSVIINFPQFDKKKVDLWVIFFYPGRERQLVIYLDFFYIV